MNLNSMNSFLVSSRRRIAHLSHIYVRVILRTWSSLDDWEIVLGSVCYVNFHMGMSNARMGCCSAIVRGSSHTHTVCRSSHVPYQSDAEQSSPSVGNTTGLAGACHVHALSYDSFSASSLLHPHQFPQHTYSKDLQSCRVRSVV
jgi:hypothetical protein